MLLENSLNPLKNQSLAGHSKTVVLITSQADHHQSLRGISRALHPGLKLKHCHENKVCSGWQGLTSALDCGISADRLPDSYLHEL